jgi:hypothetical protein
VEPNTPRANEPEEIADIEKDKKDTSEIEQQRSETAKVIPIRPMAKEEAVESVSSDDSPRLLEAFWWINSESPDTTDLRDARRYRKWSPTCTSSTASRWPKLSISFANWRIGEGCDDSLSAPELERIVTLEYRLAAAREHARNQTRIFAVDPNGKKPAFLGWQIGASTDEDRFGRWLAENPKYNLGTPTDELLVIDVDPKNGGSIDALGSPLPDTQISATPSGGWHFIYDLPADIRVRGSVGKLAPGIDVRSSGNLIVLPGSTINGRDYRWLEGYSPKERKRAIAPDWLTELARAAGKPGQKSKAAGEHLASETDETVARAEHYIRELAPEAEQGNRDSTAFKVAATLFDFPVSEGTALELMTEWNDTKCSPPLEPDIIAQKVASARRNRQNPIGLRSTSSGFESVEIAERRQLAKPPTEDAFETEEREKFYLVRADEMSRRALEKPREWLVENIMYCCDEAELIGKPGEGKSFFALDLGYHIVKGQPFAGNKVTQGPFVYIAAEAQEGIKTRVRALEQHYGPLSDAPFYFIPVAPDLAGGLRDAKALAAKIKEAERLAGKPVALFIVDTLSRAMGGRNENAPEVMGAVLNAVRYLRAETGAGSLVIHHPGWNSDHGRGHSSQFGAVDVEMWMENQVVTVRKIRDGEGGYEVAFRRKTITLGFREDGSRITSCYVETGKRQEVQVQPTAGQAEVLEIAAAVAAMGKKITVRNIQAEIKERRTTQWSLNVRCFTSSMSVR